MRVVVQRVSEASVTVEGEITGAIQAGLLVLCGFCPEDTEDDLQWMAAKIVKQRIFSDADGQMNLSVEDIGGSLLVVSQFTLFASYKKGNRPGFTGAARPELAIPLYERFLTILETLTGKRPERGIFGADMKVSLLNDGPVTLVMDTRNKE